MESTELAPKFVDEAVNADEQSIQTLFPIIYDELRRLAHSKLRQEHERLTLNTTGLVHEAYLKLVGSDTYNSRAHFFGAASHAMRQVLVDLARKRKSIKRGSGERPIDISFAEGVAEDIDLGRIDELFALDQALSELEAINPRMVRVVECRYFATLTIEDTATVLGISPRTVKRDWQNAKAWLYQEVGNRL